MKHLIRASIVLLVVLFALPGRTCGPDFPTVSFVNAHGPDAPIAEFAAGKIGVVQTTWWREPLVVAYLYFSGRPLTPPAQKSFATYWNPAGYLPPQPAKPALELWLQARGHYRAAPPSYDLTAYGGRGAAVAYPNCLDDAFTTAIATLHARAKAWGEHSADLQEWMNGQDAVFSNCGGSGSLPQSLPPSANSLLRSDRAYQIAAAYFYAEEFNRSTQLFDEISRDPHSPWRQIAALVAARAEIRAATKSDTPNPADSKTNGGAPSLATAAARLRRIIADPSLPEVHASAIRLLGGVEFRQDPEGRLRHVTENFVQGKSGSDFALEVRDFDLLLDRVDSKSFSTAVEHPRLQLTAYQQGGREPSGADLTDWVWTMQRGGQHPFEHALERWHATHSAAWLVAALSFSQSDRIDRGLLAASSEISSASPAYVTVAYHRARLLRGSGDVVAARRVLDAALRRRNALPLSALNLLLDQRMELVTTQTEFFGLLARKPFMDGPLWELANGYDEDSLCSDPACYQQFYAPDKKHLLPEFDLAAARALNTRVPLSVLAAASVSESVPANLRARLATATWTRAALLGNLAVVKELSPVVAEAHPEMKPYLASVQQQDNPESRRFALVFTILHFPGIQPFVDNGLPRTTAFARIDDYRNNWWCYELGAAPDSADYIGQYSPENPERTFRLAEPYPAFLTAAARKQADAQWTALQKFGDSDVALAREVVTYAKSHLQDPRVPEALHLAVRATRYSCSAGVYMYGAKKAGRNYSREAYTLLHKNFPKSEWARKTPYWF